MEKLHSYVNDYNKFADDVKAELMDKLRSHPEIQEYNRTIARFRDLKQSFSEIQNG